MPSALIRQDVKVAKRISLKIKDEHFYVDTESANKTKQTNERQYSLAKRWRKEEEQKAGE